MPGWPSRLSLNQFAIEPRPFSEAVQAAAAADIPAIGLSGRKAETLGFDNVASLVSRLGLQVSIYQGISYWASGVDAEGRPRTLDDLVTNFDQSQQLGSDVILGVASGGLRPGDRDLTGARRRVAAGLKEIAPIAAARHVRVAFEPIHPIFGPGRGVLFTLRETLDLLDEIDSDYLGINLETHHLWWDAHLPQQITRAGKRIFIIQINDWSPDEKDRLNSRALMGDGCVDFELFGEALRNHDGWFDVEANTDELRTLPLPELFDRIGSSFDRTIGSYLTD